MSSVSSNHGHPNQRPPVQLKMPRLSNRNLKLLPEFGDYWADYAALLLQGMHIPKKQINLKNPSKHVLSAPSEGRGREVVMGGGRREPRAVRTGAGRRGRRFRRT
jgi:hypothetical protein